MTLRVLGSGLQIGAQRPSLLVWYLRNRLRGAALPREQARTDGSARFPRFVTLKPTLRCNLRCGFCRFVASGDVFGGRDWLEAEDWLRVIDEIAPFRPYLCFTGGEPLLYPHLPALLARARRRGLFSVVTTNGTPLAARAGELMEAPPDLLVLSIDGPRETHDAVRGAAGTYDRALEGVRRLRELQKGGRWPLLVLNAALTGHTWRSARQVVEAAREFGAFALNFQHFWFMTRPMVDAHNARWGDCFPLNFDRIGGTATEDVDPDALYDLVRRLKREVRDLPVTFYPELSREELRDYYLRPEQFVRTGVPSCAWISTDILPNGDVSPCFELVTGNVLRQPFAECWNSAPFRAHRRRLVEQGPYPICARCCAYFRAD